MKNTKKTPEILHEISVFFLPADLCLSFIFHFMNFYKYLNRKIVLKNHHSRDTFEMKMKAKFTSSFQFNARPMVIGVERDFCKETHRLIVEIRRSISRLKLMAQIAMCLRLSGDCERAAS
jgi:hypothetical protein